MHEGNGQAQAGTEDERAPGQDVDRPERLRLVRVVVVAVVCSVVAAPVRLRVGIGGVVGRRLLSHVGASPPAAFSHVDSAAMRLPPSGASPT